jgi:hypothetical protein
MLLAARNASAFDTYVSRIPNGAVNGCVNCHVNSNPDLDGTRNAFGLAWRNNIPTRTWNAALATGDTDGDGFTNGQELGDPKGVWTSGAGPIPGAQVTLPANSGSKPTLTPPAIAISAPTSGSSFPEPFTGPIAASPGNAPAII